MSFTTADVAKAGRTTARGVHIWEKAGLFGPVERNRFSDRVFTAAHMDRARVIAAAQMAGMSLAEIKTASAGVLYLKILEGVDFMSRAASETVPQEFDL